MITSINRYGTWWVSAPIGLVMFSTSAAAECASREACINSHKGYCKYHEVGKEKCWYPTSGGKPVAANPKQGPGAGVAGTVKQKLDAEDDPYVWPKPSEWDK